MLKHANRMVDAILAKADAARDEGRLDEAAEFYRQVPSSHSRYRDAMVQRGNMLKDAARFEEAEQAYRTAWELRNDDADLALQLGHLAKLSGRLDDAVAWYERAAALGELHAAPELEAFGRFDDNPLSILDATLAIDPEHSATTLTKAVSAAVASGYLDYGYYRARYGAKKSIAEIQDEFLRNAGINARSYSAKIDAASFIMMNRHGLPDRTSAATHFLRQDEPNPVFSSIFDEHSLVENAFPGGIDSVRSRWAPNLIGIHIHLYYPDYIPRFRRFLSRFPVTFDLFISAAPSIPEKALSPLASLPKLRRMIVKPATNRGRNFGPMLVDFAEEIASVDLCCHLHSKKSLFSGVEQAGWASYQIEHLAGDPHLVRDHLAVFASDERISLLAPVPYWRAPLWANHWLQNEVLGKDLLKRLGVAGVDGFFPYPVGGMFWFKPSRFKALLDAGWRYEDFPDETGQIDGTIQHAIERVVALVGRHDGNKTIYYEPWTGHYGLNGYDVLAEYRRCSRHDIASFGDGDSVISFDVFDTVLYRASLDKEIGKRAVGRHLLARNRCTGEEDFIKIRNEAEAAIRRDMAYAGDVNIIEIYTRMANDGLFPRDEVATLVDLEYQADLRDQRPRTSVIQIVNTLIERGRRVAFVSDSYYLQSHVRAMLLQAGIHRIDHLFVSSEVRRRKDTGQIWPHVMARLGIGKANLLHVGDNVVADTQRVSDQNISSRLVINLIDKASYLLGRNLADPEELKRAIALGLYPVIIAAGKSPFFSD